MTPYNDDYASCRKTYSTLCIYHDDLDPDRVSERLSLAPTRAQRRGDIRKQLKDRTWRYPVGAWFLCSEGVVASKDARRHIDWILDKVQGKEPVLQDLRNVGCRTELRCFWVSAGGSGGPALDPTIMQRLASLGLELQFDFYDTM